jgi:hypothetical protein
MRRYRRALLGSVGALALLVGPTVFDARGSFNTATAPAGPPPAISYSTFAGKFGAITPAVSSAFDFIETPGPDGFLVSQVFQENDGNGSLYAYVYQIQVTNTVLTDVTGLTVPFAAKFVPFLGFGFPPATTPGKDNVYQIDGPPLTGADPAFQPGTGTVPLVEANSARGVDSSLASFGFAGGQLGTQIEGDAGPNSDLLVVFTTIGPILLPPKGMTSSGGDNYNQSFGTLVYAPGPEPSAMTLWGLSGVGLAAGAFIRRFRAPPAKMA